MNHRVAAAIAGLLACVVALHASFAQERAGTVLFVLDASGSMRSRKPPTAGSRGDTRFDSAKDKVRELSVEYERRSAALGLLVFAARSGDCRDIQLEVPVQDGVVARPLISQTLDDIQPKGWTPLAAAIERAGTVIAQRGAPDSAQIVVVTDGIETCGGDPAAVAARLKAQHGITTDIIGLDIPPWEMGKLQSIAIAGGGNFQTLMTGAGGNEIFFAPASKSKGAGPRNPLGNPSDAGAEEPLIDPNSVPKEISFGKSREREPARVAPKPAAPPLAPKPAPQATTPPQAPKPVPNPSEAPAAIQFLP